MRVTKLPLTAPCTPKTTAMLARARRGAVSGSGGGAVVRFIGVPSRSRGAGRDGALWVALLAVKRSCVRAARSRPTARPDGSINYQEGTLIETLRQEWKDERP